MADVTPTQFIYLSGGRRDSRRNGAVAFVVGDIVSLDANGDWDLSDDTTFAKSGEDGLAMAVEISTAANPATVVSGGGRIDLGPTVGLATEELIVSSNPGKIAQKADLGSARFYSSLGYMETTDIFVFAPKVTGVAKA